MAYLYLNPGHGNLFLNKTQTSYSTQTSSTYTRTGVAFGNCGICYLPTPPAGTKEVWAKFDMFNKGGCPCEFIIRSSSTFCEVKVNSNAYDNTWIRCVINDSEKYCSETLERSTIFPIWVHLKSGTDKGFFEYYLNGLKKFEFEGNVLDGNDITSIRFYTTSGNVFSSNIIVSDTDIAKTENVITLPISATDATMTDNGDGSYSAKAAGEYVKQTIDKASLKQTYDANKTIITGVALVGRPAYYDGEGLYHMEALKDNTVLSEEELTANDGAYSIMSATSVSCTIDELATQYGWRAKA